MPTATETEFPPIDQDFEPGEVDVEPVQQEAEPLRESADTVGQLMDQWRTEYETAAGPVKQELAYRLVKMGEALALSGLHADEVKIRETAPGILGFYNPATGEVAITPAGLSLPAEHFRDVLVHEATHAGKTTGKVIADEGLTQIVTIKRISGAMPGIYESEQQSAHEAFTGVGINRVLDRYDFDHPQELIGLYLETEWHDAWRDRWEKELGKNPEIKSDEGRQELLEGEMKDWVEQLEKAFEDAAPRLFAKAKESGFVFSTTHEEIFGRIAKETELVVNKE